jgi:hypothetical protein
MSILLLNNACSGLFVAAFFGLGVFSTKPDTFLTRIRKFALTLSLRAPDGGSAVGLFLLGREHGKLSLHLLVRFGVSGLDSKLFLPL